MRLTKLQRYTAYIILEKEIGGRNEKSQLCHLIFYLFGISNEGYDKYWEGDWFLENPSAESIYAVLNHFPELKSKQPLDGWPDTDAAGISFRRSALKQCIAETSPD